MKETNKFIIAILLYFISCIGCLAQKPSELFRMGNDFYQKGQYDDAINSYSKVVDSNLASPELFYNLGNAYYKKGDIANTILYYEKALILSPDDEDIRFNLNLANTMVVDKIIPKPDFFLESWWKSFTSIFPVKTWSFILIISNILLFLSISWFVIAKSSKVKKLSFFSFFCFLIASGISFFAANRTYNEVATQKFAIVFTSNGYVKSSPDDKSTDLFVLHQGTKLRLLDEIGEWYQIEIADGNKGWFKKQNLQFI